MSSAFTSNAKSRKLANSVSGASSQRHISEGVSSLITRIIPRRSTKANIPPLAPPPLSQAPPEPEPEPEPDVGPTEEAKNTQVCHISWCFHFHSIWYAHIQTRKVIDSFMSIEDHLQDLLLHHCDNPHKDETCPCKRGLRRVQCHCDGCFQYSTSCENCFVDRHRNNPFHWALVWENDIWNKRDFSELLSDTCFIQLGHVEDQLACSGAGAPIRFIVTHINGVHTTRIKFCGCTTAPSNIDQLVLSNLFPATTNDPKSAFTLALLKQFRIHNLQSKCGAFDYIRSIRRFSDNAFTAKVPVSNYVAPKTFCLTCMSRILIRVFFECAGSGMYCKWKSGVVLTLESAISFQPVEMLI